MINDIKKICHKHKLNVSKIDFTQDISDVIEDIEARTRKIVEQHQQDMSELAGQHVNTEDGELVS